jgi:hypothetical protein
MKLAFALNIAAILQNFLFGMEQLPSLPRSLQLRLPGGHEELKPPLPVHLLLK